MVKEIVRGIPDESAAIRQEMSSMTDEQLSNELEKLRSVAPHTQRAALFSMELQTRKLWEKAGKEKATMFGR